ncbi:protein let-653-like isoform X2 [Danio aesculapii]|uniref:protein let-653-like isoform X2 n=1 Tax=Danio aesculapii TaxID=1142201 RepID=UPI0024BF87FB|nr:protein let-653-like isoform X2 [Danio aesculapii]
MELFIFIVFQLLVEVQTHNTLQKPFISVSEDQLSISCEIPASVRADVSCNLYTGDGASLSSRDSQWSSSGEHHLCMFYQTLSELLKRSGNIRQLSCDYSLKTEPDIRSPHSDPYTRVSPNPTKQTTTAKKTSSTVKSTSKTTTYRTHYSKPNLPTSTTKQPKDSTVKSTAKASPETDPKTTTSTAKASQADKEKQTVSVISTTETSMAPRHDKEATWLIPLVSTAVGVILCGFLCLCWFASKRRRKNNKMRTMNSDVSSQGIGMSCSGPPEIYSLITSAPATSQPIYEDVLVNKQQHQQNTEKNKSVDHLYSPIHTPVQSNSGDQVYSLVKTH